MTGFREINSFLMQHGFPLRENYGLGLRTGLYPFFPKDIISNNYVPPVILASFKIFHKEIDLNYETSYAQEIEIPYSENVFSFVVAALNYIDPQRNQYAYKLEGFNQDWTYTQFDPGNYIYQP